MVWPRGYNAAICRPPLYIGPLYIGPLYIGPCAPFLRRLFLLWPCGCMTVGLYPSAYIKQRVVKTPPEQGGAHKSAPRRRPDAAARELAGRSPCDMA